MMKTFGLTAALATGLTGHAWADTIQATNWMTPAHILNEFPYQALAKDVEAASGGATKIEVYSGGSLVPANATMQGIRDGVAQIGVVYPGYTPSELPVSNTVNDLGFVLGDDMAAAMAWTELGLTNEVLKAEWDKNGGVFLGGYSTPVYHFMCVKDISGPDSAKGLKIRTAGGAQTAWVEALGAVPVSVPIGDVYSGLERGSLDCTLSDPTNLDKGNKFWEVAKTVNKLPMGVVLGATYVANKDWWAGLPPEEKRMLLDQFAMGVARAQVGYHVGVEAALKGSADRGLTITEADPAMIEKLDAFKKQLTADLPKKAMADRGIEDPTAMISAFLELDTKWQKLLDGVDRTDPEAVAKVLRENLYDKIDPATMVVN